MIKQAFKKMTFQSFLNWLFLIFALVLTLRMTSVFESKISLDSIELFKKVLNDDHGRYIFLALYSAGLFFLILAYMLYKILRYGYLMIKPQIQDQIRKYTA